MARQVLLALAAAALLAAAGGGAAAEPAAVGPLTFSAAWTRATPPGAPTAAGYLTITNNGTEADRLIVVASPIAERAELHTMEIKDGVMSMRPVRGGIEIPAGGGVTLAPGGLHIMFVTLKDALTEGDAVPLTLTFEKAGSVAVFLSVTAIGAKGPSIEAMDDMDHEDMAPGGGSGQ